MDEHKFRNDITPITKTDMTDDEWNKCCPAYGHGYKYLSGLYCDYCNYLYDNEGRLCPNNK